MMNAPEPQSNQRGIETEGSRIGQQFFWVPQSNQRGIETSIAIHPVLGLFIASIEPAWD